MMIRSLGVLLVLCMASGCGGDDDGSAQGSGAGTTSTSGDETMVDADGDGWPDETSDEPVVDHRAGAMEQLSVSGPDAPWVSMSRGDKEMYMIGKVMPIMNELFARQFGSRAANFGCETCHGRNMREVSFAMPSQAAMPVPRQGSPAYARMERQFPDSVRFMREVVTPTMGTLLGIDGYTCNHCHPGGT
jgi:hypothetical protein